MFSEQVAAILIWSFITNIIAGGVALSTPFDTDDANMFLMLITALALTVTTVGIALMKQGC